MSPKSLFVVIMTIVLSISVVFGQEPEQTKFRSVQKPTRMVEIEERLSLLSSLDEEYKAEIKRIEREKVPPDANYYEYRITVRTEMISLKKEYDKLQKEMMKGESKEMKEARNQLQKEADKDRKREMFFASAKARANISGCDSGSVFVSPSAVKFNNYAAQVTVRVVNNKDFPINIETSFRGIGIAIGNLCPHGSATLGFVLEYPETISHQSMNVTLTAIGKNVGTRFTSSFQFSLYDYSTYNTYNKNYQKEDKAWEIR